MKKTKQKFVMTFEIYFKHANSVDNYNLSIKYFIHSFVCENTC